MPKNLPAPRPHTPPEKSNDNTPSPIRMPVEEPYGPTEEEILEKLKELENAEPMRVLRWERNRRLQETDWRFRSDLTPSQEWIDYSQALRDLPSTSSPELDENGQLSNVTWPTKPE